MSNGFRPFFLAANWELFDENNVSIGGGDELSGFDFGLEPGEKPSWPEQAGYGHTEGKIIDTLKGAKQLRPGRTLEINGQLPPCQNCQNIMQAASQEFRMNILYRDASFAQTAWQNGVKLLNL